jgi:hypothetical protein
MRRIGSRLVETVLRHLPGYVRPADEQATQARIQAEQRAQERLLVDIERERLAREAYERWEREGRPHG